jgi:hypothetical protein
MTLALQCLVGLTLLVCGAVAALPEIWPARIPQPRAETAAGGAPPLWIVRSPGNRWYVNGDHMPRSRLASLLRTHPEVSDIRFLPSAALSIGEVAESLGWLRSLSRDPVVLELAPQEP